MIQSVDLKNVGVGGINADFAPWDLPPEVLTNGINLRIGDGYIASSGGSEAWLQLKKQGISFIYPTPTNAGDKILLAGTTGVYATDGFTNAELKAFTTPLLDPRGWSACAAGGIPVINHPESGAFYWYPADLSQQLKPLPFSQSKSWDTALGKSAQVIRAHRNWFFMLNLNETINGVSQHIVDGYRWSHPSDINSIPPTWDETDRNYLAGMAQVGDESGQIIDGASLRDSFIIYSEKAINALEPSGDIFVWNRRQVSLGSGLLNKNCLVHVNGVHYFISPDDIMAFDGTEVKSILNGILRKHFQASLNHDQISLCQAVVNQPAKEIWFCIPKVGSTVANLAYVYNWIANAWTFRDIRPNLSYLAYGSRNKPTITWDFLSKLPTPPIWERYDGPWGTPSLTPFDDTMLGVSADGALFDVDPAFADKGYHSYMERVGLVIGGQRNVKTITKVFPKLEGVSKVNITFGAQDYAGSPIRWNPPIPFDAVKDRRIALKCTGALHAYRIESADNTPFQFNGMEIEYAEAGLK